MNFNINVTLRKLAGIFIVLVGLYGFLYSIYADKYVSESVLLVTIGSGMLGYTKYLTSKNINKNE